MAIYSRRDISVEASEVSVTPMSGSLVNVNLTLERGELIGLLDEKEIDDVISFLEDEGYNVTKGD